MNERPSFSGQRFGRLLIKEKTRGKPPHYRASYRCVCDCGTEITVLQQTLIGNKAKSCGCIRSLRREQHGMSRAVGAPNTDKTGRKAEYRIWLSMRSRCLSKRSTKYHNYGGRGISVCEKWSSFSAFLRDMGERPSADYSLERLDNSGPYSPENCAWATRKQQQRNRRNTSWINFMGRKMCVAEAAEISGVRYALIKSRLARGWSDAAAVSAPRVVGGQQRVL